MKSKALFSGVIAIILIVNKTFGTKAKSALALGLIPVAAVGMTGCVATNELSDDVEPSSNSQEETQRPSETEDAAGPALVGDTIQSRNSLLDGQKAYNLKDGSLIVVSPSEPLPEPVVADINKRGAETPQWNGVEDSTGTSMSANSTASAQLSKNVTTQTGKQVMLIRYGYYACTSAAEFHTGYVPVSLDVKMPCKHLSTAEEAVAQAEEAIAQQENPENWVIVKVF